MNHEDSNVRDLFPESSRNIDSCSPSIWPPSDDQDDIGFDIFGFSLLQDDNDKLRDCLE